MSKELKSKLDAFANEKSKVIVHYTKNGVRYYEVVRIQN